MDDNTTFPLNIADATHQWDASINAETITLQPGDFYTTDKDEVITTTLGSCIAACIRDRDLGVGGMNHFMLPSISHGNNPNWELTAANTASRYGAFAMESLINMILKKGGKRNNLEFKFFGGGNMLSSATSIGEANIRFIHEYMDAEGYGIEAECLGRPHPMKLHYFPKTGVARIKKLTHSSVTIVANENRYANELERKLSTQDVEIFKHDRPTDH